MRSTGFTTDHPRKFGDRPPPQDGELESDQLPQKLEQLYPEENQKY
jgi:hypothetical protein